MTVADGGSAGSWSLGRVWAFLGEFVDGVEAARERVSAPAGDVTGGSDYEAAVLVDTLLRDSGVAHMANTALGRAFGVSERSVRDRRKAVARRYPEFFEAAARVPGRLVADAWERTIGVDDAPVAHVSEPATPAAAPASSAAVVSPAPPAPGAASDAWAVGEPHVDAGSSWFTGEAGEVVVPPGVTVAAHAESVGEGVDLGLAGERGGSNVGAAVGASGASDEVLADRARRALKEAHDAATELAASKLGVSPEAVTPYRASLRIPEMDGSWLKINIDPSQAALEQGDRVAFETLRADMDKYADDYKRTHEGAAGVGGAYADGTLVVALADFQTGKTDVHGGTVNLYKRVRSVYAQMEAELPRYRTIIAADLGDIIENFMNVGSQRQSNDLNLTDQLEAAISLIWEGLRVLHSKCDNLIYVAVPSNHCEVRTGVGNKNRASSVLSDDYGIHVQRQIRRMAEMRPDVYGNMSFVCPSDYDAACTVKPSADDKSVLFFEHGHVGGGASQAKMRQHVKNMQAGRIAYAHIANIFVHGHYHTPEMYLVGDKTWVVGVSSIDSGSSWFTNMSGESAPSAVTSFVAKDGMVRDMRLWTPADGVGLDDAAEGARTSLFVPGEGGMMVNASASVEVDERSLVPARVDELLDGGLRG
jgi:gp76